MHELYIVITFKIVYFFIRATLFLVTFQWLFPVILFPTSLLWTHPLIGCSTRNDLAHVALMTV